MTTKNRVSSPPKEDSKAWKIVLGVLLFFAFCFVIKLQWNSWFPEKDNDQIEKNKNTRIEMVQKQKHTKTLFLNSNSWKTYMVIQNWERVFFDIPKKDIYIKRRGRDGVWEQEAFMKKGSRKFPFEPRADIDMFAFRTVNGTLSLDVWQWNF